jgi:ribulose 1,5-bisphosphate carboxylase large subunit-like protein
VRQAWAAWQRGQSVADAAAEAPELQAALGFFGRKAG